jgi:cystathionine gamma-synthase
MNPYLQPIESGKSLPFDNPHAVSVSLPTIDDIIGYEEKDPAVVNAMQSGYPRFFTNKIVEKLVLFVRTKHNIPDSKDVFPIMDTRALELLLRRFDMHDSYFVEQDCVFVVLDKTHFQHKSIKDFIRYSGLFLSSRKAEDGLVSLGLIQDIYSEDVYANGKDFVVEELAKAYLAKSNDDVLLSSCGMNAIYSVFEAIRKTVDADQRQNIMQIGCLYIDSDCLIRDVSDQHVFVARASEMEQIEKVLSQNHRTLAAVFTEVPNNPLIECADIVKLYDLCRQYHIPLVVDSTFGTPHNMTFLPYCDVAVESLTKFACGHGDSIMGATILNHQSEFYSRLKENLRGFTVQPYHRDTDRLAVGIADYERRMFSVSQNTKQIISYLEKSPAIGKVFSVLNPDTFPNFDKIRKHPDALPGLVSFVVKSGFTECYNRLNLPKGPSLGTNFTLAMPYVYLAHYESLKTPEGREKLAQMGLSAELLRISVGIEPADEIIAVLKAAGI